MVENIRLTNKYREYMKEENQTLYEFGNFHLHEDLHCADMTRVFRDGFLKSDKEWHGLMTSAIHNWLTPYAKCIPVDAHSSNGKSTIEQIIKLEEEGTKVTSLEASMSGFTYNHPEYNDVSDRVYNVMSAGNAGENTYNIGAVMPQCLSVAAVNIYGTGKNPIFTHCGYSSNDVNADTLGKPVDISGAGPAEVMFYADKEWRKASYSGTSMRCPYVGSIMTKNGQAFYNAQKRYANYKEMNEMLFNFTVDVEPMRTEYINNYGLEEGIRQYVAKVGFGVCKLPSILLEHWGTWYYSYLIDFNNMQPIRGLKSLGDSITRGQLAIMLAQIYADYPHSGLASLAVRDYLNVKGIPFKGRVTNGKIDLALEDTLTRAEFWVMMRRVVEFLNKENTGLDNVSWENNIVLSMEYLESKGIVIFDKGNLNSTLQIASACAILARINGYIEWSDKKYI